MKIASNYEDEQVARGSGPELRQAMSPKGAVTGATAKLDTTIPAKRAKTTEHGRRVRQAQWPAQGPAISRSKPFSGTSTRFSGTMPQPFSTSNAQSVKRGRPVKEFLKKMSKVEVEGKSTTNDASQVLPYKSAVTTPVYRADTGSSIKNLKVVSLFQ